MLLFTYVSVSFLRMSFYAVQTLPFASSTVFSSLIWRAALWGP
jgi:hypothetical protein